tara:strand:- start:469 stop:1191 length:723 start_codon:yes stop_codon:yes gene_type:complete
MRFATALLGGLLLITSGTIVFAQDGRARSIDIEMGVALPTGEFAEVDTEEAGLARPGVAISIANRLALQETFGLTLTTMFNVNGVDPEATSDYLDDLRTSYPSVTWSIDTSTWLMATVLVGPYFSVRSGDLELVLKGGIGASLAVSPRLEVTGVSGLNRLVITSESATGTGLALYGGGQLLMHFSDSAAVYTGVSYLRSEPSFDRDSSLTENGVKIVTETDSFNQVISFITIPLGIAYRF